MTHTDDDNCLQVVGHSERQDDLVVYAEKGNEELIKKFNVALSDYKKAANTKDSSNSTSAISKTVLIHP